MMEEFSGSQNQVHYLNHLGDILDPVLVHLHQ